MVNHFTTIADLHRAESYDPMSDDVLMLTGQASLSVGGVRKEECGDIHRVGKKGLSVRGCQEQIDNLKRTRVQTILIANRHRKTGVPTFDYRSAVNECTGGLLSPIVSQSFVEPS